MRVGEGGRGGINRVSGGVRNKAIIVQPPTSFDGV